MNITKHLAWLVFALISVVLLYFMLTQPPLNFGGDIAEYYGITETILTDHTLHLTPTTLSILSKVLQPAYYNDPGYYIQGVDGNRYPVHFIFYSLIVLPVRMILKLFSAPEVNALRLTNLLILTATAWYLLRSFSKTNIEKLSLITLLYTSPLLWFISWPGPDLYYLCLLLISLFLFFQKRYLAALFLTVLASWHSQPLAITAFGMLLYYFFHIFHTRKTEHEIYVGFHIKAVLIALGITALILIPYAYNYLAFGTLTPWTILQDGWTQLNGFGLHNASLQKLFEQLFDLNIGLFWYAPVIVILGVYYVVKNWRQHKDVLFMILLFYPITAIFYQTNPAWHYGTSGYGPSRHAIFLLPLFLYFAYRAMQGVRQRIVIIVLVIFSQLPLLALNGFAFPNMLSTLYNTPYAIAVLNRFPELYNPTPEIFVDRTSHTDESLPHSAVYKDNGICKKAYVLLTDADLLKAQCGSIPPQYEKQLDNPYHRKANYTRSVKTVEATFWPDPGSCSDQFVPTPEKPYHCMQSLNDVVKGIGITDLDRLDNLDGLPGVWKLKKGSPVTITIPPGYFIDYTAVTGIYVNY